MALMSLTKQHQTQLLALARDSIRHGLEFGKPMRVDPRDYPGDLGENRATFVTLLHGKQLRGCIGMLEAIRPLAEDVSENAFAAAFRDGRFPPLRESEFNGLEIHISILTPAEAMQFASEQDLLNQLRPGMDGLILEEGWRKSTFLPSVWETLPDPVQFLRRLKEKAGLPAAYWSDAIRAYRYTTDYIEE